MKSKHNPHMSASMQAIFVIAAVCLGISLISFQARANSRLLAQSGSKATLGLRQAEDFFKKARTNFSASREKRVEDLNKALEIYAQLGHLPKVVEAGLWYQKFLRTDEDFASDFVQRKKRSLDLLLGECYLNLGHYLRAEDRLNKSLSDSQTAALPPAKRIVARTLLARIAEKRGMRGKARRLWQQVESFALDLLDESPADLALEERIECVWNLADSYRFQKAHDKGIARLKQLLPMHDQLDDANSYRQTLSMLSDHHAAKREFNQAVNYLLEARKLLPAANDPLPAAKLADKLAGLYTSQAKNTEAELWRKRAVQGYLSVLKPKGAKADTIQVVTAFWNLLELFQKNDQHQIAIKLTEVADKEWSNVLRSPRLKAYTGSLQAFLNSFGSARKLLGQAVTDLERQEPKNFVYLSQAWINLAILEQSYGNSDRAEELAAKSLSLYTVRKWLPDQLLVETYSVQGTVLAVRGRYIDAVNRFQKGMEICEKLGDVAAPKHTRLLLNRAALHNSQGIVELALQDCEKAQDTYQRYASKDTFDNAVIAAARASLYTRQGKIGKAFELVPGILRVCEKHKKTSDPVLVAALHVQGLYHLIRREIAPAKKSWLRMKAIQEENSLLLPRTLNYLGLTAEIEGKLGQAEKYFRSAKAIGKKGDQVYPATRFITLWRLAHLTDLNDKHAEARRLLEEAVAVVEKTRARTFANAVERANFFAQFEPGYERLIDWSVRDGDIDGALKVMIRSRNRALIDQINLAVNENVDTRKYLTNERGKKLLKQEEDLRLRINGLRARTQLIITEDAKDSEKLQAELEKAQRTYVKIRRDILTESEAFRNLPADVPSESILSTLRKNVLRPKTLMLAYHIGKKRSYLLLLGDKSVKPQAFPLAVNTQVVNSLQTLKIAAKTKLPKEELDRGLKLRRKLKQNLDTSVKSAIRVKGANSLVYLNQSVTRALVDRYLLQIREPSEFPLRGLKIKPKILPKQKPHARDLELLGNSLLPPAVRKRIKDSGAESLVVIPDGALHKLPFEALLLRYSPTHRFVLDELPPIIYAPSMAVLARLIERKRSSKNGPSLLLTVCNPIYPKGSKLVPLEGTAQESKSIREFFKPAEITLFEGRDATESAVRRSVAGKQIIHLAAHGLAEADDKFGNLFGAFVFTAPLVKASSPEKDGFLSLNEIYTLPLKDCELAVLSACETNVGPQQSLEAGVTLASGFLAAGARRVVASHWSVGDTSTAILMKEFFRRIRPAKGKQPMSYAKALREARLILRNSGESEKSAPLRWAPFVVLGAPYDQ